MNREKALDKDVVAANLLLIRNLTGLSMNDFAPRVGITKDQVNSYERARSLPPQPVLMRLAELAGITLEQLVMKKITKEEVIKEMFATLSEKGELKKRDVVDATSETIKTMKATIDSQAKQIEGLIQVIQNLSKA